VFRPIIVSDIKFKKHTSSWISAYRYNDKVSLLVNARTGDVQGERPYSTIVLCLQLWLSWQLLHYFSFSEWNSSAGLFDGTDFGNLAYSDSTLIYSKIHFKPFI
jgi:hypothetical protein